jgi:hypothetical protein
MLRKEEEKRKRGGREAEEGTGLGLGTNSETTTFLPLLWEFEGSISVLSFNTLSSFCFNSYS